MEHLPFLGALVLLWLAMSAALALLGGWFALARRYRSGGPMRGERFRFVSGSLGAPVLPVGYGRSLTLTLGEEAFGLAVFLPLRFFSPPLRVPWAAVESVEARRSLFGRYVAVRIRDHWPTLSIRGEAGERLARRYEQWRSGMR